MSEQRGAVKQTRSLLTMANFRSWPTAAADTSTDQVRLPQRTLSRPQRHPVSHLIRGGKFKHQALSPISYADVPSAKVVHRLPPWVARRRRTPLRIRWVPYLQKGPIGVTTPSTKQGFCITVAGKAGLGHKCRHASHVGLRPTMVNSAWWRRWNLRLSPRVRSGF